MTRAAIPEADAKVLRYAGFLGHTFVVVTDREGHMGPRGVCHESCDKHQALFAARTEYVDAHPVVYQQFRRGEWRRVYP